MTLSKKLRQSMYLKAGDFLAFIDLKDHIGIFKLNDEKLKKVSLSYNQRGQIYN